MYEERKKKFNWKGFILKLIILLLTVFLFIKLLPLKTNETTTNGYSKIFNANFTKFKEVGNNYFTKDKLPKDDKEVKVSLKELINDKKITTLKTKDKECNSDDSYIKAYKKNIGYELEVYLECGEEKDTSYIYLGCFDDCKVTTKDKNDNNDKTTTKKSTSTSTTTKKNDSNKKTTTKKITTNNTTKTTTKKVTAKPTTTTTTKRRTTTVTPTYNYTKKTTTTTTTTTRIQKYAVIFNSNGGSKVNTQNIIKGNVATKPANPVKQGFTFKGWYLDDKEYNFNTPVTNNIILIAKWELINTPATKTVVTKTYDQVAYSNAIINKDSKSIGKTDSVSIPENIKNYNNVKIKNVTYIRNVNSVNDLNKMNLSYLSINNFGTVDNIYIYNTNNAVIWNGLVSTNCTNPMSNLCRYGIVYRITWQYDE